MKGFKRVLTILLIFLGPGFIIWWMVHTINNKFLSPPVVGWSLTKDSSGNIIDSSYYEIPEFQLTSFSGAPINRDSIRNKFIILTTVQNGCPELSTCGLGFYHFNEIIYEKMIKHADNYSNVRVLSILTDENGRPDSIPGELLKEEIATYDQRYWWFVKGDPKPLYGFHYYGDLFFNHPSTPDEGEIGSYAFVSSLVLIDKEGHIRGVSGAKKDADLRNFFDLLKLVKKEEFNAEREKNK